MLHAELIDDATLAQNLTRNMLNAVLFAEMMTSDPTEAAAVLIGAASVIIERNTGAALAPAAMMALIAPTIAQWNAKPGADRIQ